MTPHERAVKLLRAMAAPLRDSSITLAMDAVDYALGVDPNASSYIDTAAALSRLADELEAAPAPKRGRWEVEIIAGTDPPDGDGWGPGNAFVDNAGMNCVLWKREVPS